MSNPLVCDHASLRISLAACAAAAVAVGGQERSRWADEQMNFSLAGKFCLLLFYVF